MGYLLASQFWPSITVSWNLPRADWKISLQCVMSSAKTHWLFPPVTNMLLLCSPRFLPVYIQTRDLTVRALWLLWDEKSRTITYHPAGRKRDCNSFFLKSSTATTLLPISQLVNHTFSLMFGQVAVDFLLCRVQEPSRGDTYEWIKEHQTRLKLAFECAKERRKKNYDQLAPPKFGLSMLLQNFSARGCHMIQDLLSSVVHRVCKVQKALLMVNGCHAFHIL